MATSSPAPKVAIITDTEHPGLRPDDVCLAQAFADRGARSHPIPWGTTLDPLRFDLAVVRTPWDYFLRPGQFLSWAEDSPVPLLNDPAVLRWNHNKRYLLELSRLGHAELPKSQELPMGSRQSGEVPTLVLLEALGTGRAVVKPLVSGGARCTRVISSGAPLRWMPEDEGDYLAQAFVPEVTSVGEWSLIYFGGALSHAVRKTPEAGDFRVQEDFGGAVHVEEPPALIRTAADRVMGGATEVLGLARPLPYARVDMVESSGSALLMELELIEPELFFRADAQSPRRYVNAVLDAYRDMRS